MNEFQKLPQDYYLEPILFEQFNIIVYLDFDLPAFSFQGTVATAGSLSAVSNATGNLAGQCIVARTELCSGSTMFT